MSDLTPEPEERASPKGKKRKRQAEPVVYDIPPVERLSTSYRGRLGYACLNTILRQQNPPVFCSRTCRIDTIKKQGLEYVKELGRLNVVDLIKLIEWNAEHHIFFMRMSSEMFPFASHEEYGYDLSYAQTELAAAGAAATRCGMRLTMHPGQFTQLGSPREAVVRNAIRELGYHAELMDRMGLGPDSVMIIHGGGVYGDQAAALARFRTNHRALPENVRARLVLENDEVGYSAGELLPVCEELGIPLVFDYHHDALRPSEQSAAEMMPRILGTWERRGIRPKQHLSEPRPGAQNLMEKRAHADRCQRLPDILPDDMDLMIEAKDKEQAVFHLFRIYDLQPVIQADLRPPAAEESMQTKGCKRSKKGVNAAGDSDAAPTPKRRKAQKTRQRSNQSPAGVVDAELKDAAGVQDMPDPKQPNDELVAAERPNATVNRKSKRLVTRDAVVGSSSKPTPVTKERPVSEL